ncbi:hypothetical protein FXO38_34326 [Capsicum annuum]|nr:hypothetical protein FXO38_34326 [Capsicum annuum]KAF3655986.1 hypothetical protein FXO37_15644 [Capsicum annuum]
MSCRSPHEAIMIFDRILNKDLVSWFALLCGCVRNGLANKSMQIFCDMMANDIRPDVIVMVKVLGACFELGVLELTSCLDSYVIRGGFLSNSFVGASLIDCYARCGSLGRLTEKDVVNWSSMLQVLLKKELNSST